MSALIRENTTISANSKTSNKCVEWVKDHLALDDIRVYLHDKNVSDAIEALQINLYDYMEQVIDTVPAGTLTEQFYTVAARQTAVRLKILMQQVCSSILKIETGKTELIRAVVEGHLLPYEMDAWQKDRILKRG